MGNKQALSVVNSVFRAEIDFSSHKNICIFKGDIVTDVESVTGKWRKDMDPTDVEKTVHSQK